MTRRRDQRGAASALSVVLAGVLVTVAVLASALAGVLVVRREVAVAADLAALAGASAVQLDGDVCASVRRIAAANGAEVVGCHREGDTVRVRVQAGVEVLGRRLTVQAVARAGPR